MADERRSPSWKSTDWRGGAGSATSHAGKKKSATLFRFLLLAAALATVGIIAGLIVFLRPPKKPIFLSIAVTEYVNRSIPPNPWARQDGDSLRAVFGKDSVQAFQSQERDLILRELAQLADRTATSAEKNRPVIVHLSAYAVVRNNSIYLLAGFSPPDHESSWLPFAEVIEVLRRCAGGCLVLLDVARPIADSHLGFLEESSGSAIHNELKRLESENKLPFLVLTSCSENEVSHSSAILRRSVFAFFVEQGLLGHADGWEIGKSKDGQVSVRELAAYVKAQVSEWAAQLRLTPQTPALYGSGKDFVLITPPAKTPSLGLPESTDAYPDNLNKAWLARDGWLADESWRRVPRAFRQLETALIRAEQRWLAGHDMQTIQNELQAEMQELENHRQKSKPAEYPSHSLAQIQRQKSKDESGLRTQLQVIIDRLQSKSPLMPGELDMLWQKTFEKPLESSQSGLAAWILFSALVEIPDPSREQLKAGFDILSKLQPRPRHLEVQLLQLLIDLEPAQWQRWQELPGTAHVVLRSGQLAEQVSASDPRVLPWIQEDLAAANALRRDGLFQLAVGESADRRQGREKLDESIQRYQGLLSTATALERAYLQLEVVLRILPALPPVIGRKNPNADTRQLWTSLTQNTERFITAMNPSARAAIKEIESLTQDLAVLCNNAQAQFETAGLDRQLRRLNTPAAPAALDLFEQLHSPLWPAAQRARLYAAAAKLERETAESAIAKANQIAPATPASLNSERLTDAAAWRARLAIDLLKLDGLSDAASLEAELAKAGTASDGWQKLGARIRTAASATLTDRFKNASLPQQERAGWLLHPDDLAAVAMIANEPFPREPALVNRRQQWTTLWRWLGEERYVKDANLFLKVATRPELAAYGKALNDVGRELSSRSP